MAVQIAFVFQSPDRTDYLNQRLAGLIGKGIYSGAELTPTGSGLTATRAPFFALGRDGITIWDTEVGTFTYTSGIDNYHVLLAKYNPLGTPSTPVVQELVMSASEYNSHVDKPYLIVIGKIVPAGGVLLSSEIDYGVRDEVGPFGRAQLRGVLDLEANLPTGSPNWNRSGDMYICTDSPPPGGGGLYMYEEGTGWRLVAAKGAATLDGAYDNNGAGGPPGYGRHITVDSGAVELLQDNISQRQNDPANAALRIRKTGTTVKGDVGTDIVLSEDNDAAGLLIRSHFTAGTHIEADEPVNANGATLTGTRGAANWNHSSIHKIPLLVELTDSTVGNDGLYIASPNGAASCALDGLDASGVVSLSVETGTALKANFFSIRHSIGAAGVALLTKWPSGGTYVASTEFYGNRTGGIGKVIYYTAGTLNYLWEYRLTQAGTAAHRVAAMTDGGSMILTPLSGSEDWHTLEAKSSHGSFAAIHAEHTGGGHGIRATSTGIGVYSSSSAHNAGEFWGTLHGIYASTSSATWSHAALRAVANSGAAAVYATGTANVLIASTSGTGKRGCWGENQNAGDTTGYGVYGKHAGSGAAIYGESLLNGWGVRGYAQGSGAGVGVYGEALGDGAHGVEGQAAGADGMGVFGNHQLVADDGWGVVGHNNNANVLYAGVDGFAWGGGPGVKGGSVFGGGVEGHSSILSLLPGVEGVGDGFGTGVKGTSLFGTGVEGSSYGYSENAQVSYRVPLTQMEPVIPSDWRYGQVGIDHGWDMVAGSGARALYWVWTDFPDGLKVEGISFTAYHPSGTNVSLVVFKRTITWDYEILVNYAWEFQSASFAYMLQTSGAGFGGSGDSTLTYGPGTPGTPFTATTLEQPARLGTSTADLIGSEFVVFLSMDTTGCKLKHLVLSCDCRGASPWVNPTTV
jgi:hypothetical protein